MKPLLLLLALSALGEETKVEQVTEGRVLFGVGSAQVGPKARTQLLILARRVLKDPRDLLVVGHSDRRGDDDANKSLSRRRAAAVAAVLTSAGLDRGRIQTLGAGFGDPVDPRASAEADAKNRRVEVWLIGSTHVGWVSWRYRRLEAKTPERAWFDAVIKLPLEAQHRVRTRARSAGEITFREGYVLYLGPNGSLVVFEPRARRAPSRPGRVQLEEGSLLANLPAAASTPLDIATGAARVRGAGRKVRIQHDDASGTSLVSVYDGALDVAAQGKRVRVRRGFGTRVRRGRAPERPTPLPAPPSWTEGRDTILALRCELPEQCLTAPLRWKSPQSRFRIEVARDDDLEFRQVLSSTVSPRPTWSPVGLEPGAYRVRIAALDAKGLIGRANLPRMLLVAEAVNLSPAPSGLTRDGPGATSAPVIPGRTTRWRLDDGTVDTTTLAAGSHQLVLVAEHPEGTFEQPLAVEVLPQRLTLSATTADAAQYRLAGLEGPAADPLWVRPIGPKLDVCSGRGDEEVELRPCDGAEGGRPEPGPILKLRRRAFAQRFLVYGRHRHGRTLSVPARPGTSTRAASRTDPLSFAPRRPEAFFGLEGGARFGETAHGRLGFELGARVPLDSLDLRLSLRGGYGRPLNPQQGLEDLSGGVGADFAWLLGRLRPFVGVAGGIQSVTVAPGGPAGRDEGLEPFGLVRVGLGYAIGDLEVYAAGQVASAFTASGPTLETLVRPAAVLGFRAGGVRAAAAGEPAPDR